MISTSSNPYPDNFDYCNQQISGLLHDYCPYTPFADLLVKSAKETLAKTVHSKLSNVGRLLQNGLPAPLGKVAIKRTTVHRKSGSC